MKYYLAAKFSRRLEMEKAVVPFMSAAFPGSECVARWVFGGEDGLTRQDIAELDLNDVNKADTLIIFTHPRSTPQPGGGRFVEMGYALAKGKRVVVIGPKENVFTDASGVEVYETLTEFADA